MRPEERIAALGFSEADTATLTEHFLDAESRGKLGHGLSRIDWLETLSDLQPDAHPRRLLAEPGYERWDGNGALGYLTLAAIVDAQLESPPAHARVVVASNCFPTGVLGWYVRRLAEARPGRRADRDLARPAAAPGGRRAARGHEPTGDRDPELGRQAARRRRLDGRGHLRRRPARRRRPEELVPFGGEQSHKAFALALGLELFVDALAGEGYGAVLVVAPPEADPVPALREQAAGLRLPGDA